MAAGKRGLQTGLKQRCRTVILFMDSTILREIPPLYHAWAPIGEQAVVPIVGGHGKRVLSGVLNIQTGACLTRVTKTFRQEEFQDLLRCTRRRWRGWHIVLFVDRHGAHKAPASTALAEALTIELRWLPTACPELNVMDTLWRSAKAEIAANEPNPNVDATTQAVIDYIMQLKPPERLHKAGVLSDDFWLKGVRAAHVSKDFSRPT
jgi:hypothetical protein